MPKHAHKQAVRRKAMPEEVEREWLSVKDLMTITGLGRTKCYELVASGELEAIKCGRAVRISMASYEEWTRRNRYTEYPRG
jgi:excisionase family DNA binding protein